MESGFSKDSNWWVFTLPAAIVGSNNLLLDATVLFALIFGILFFTILSWALSPGGGAWDNGRSHRGRRPIPGLRGLPVVGSLFDLRRGNDSLAHRTLATAASRLGATQLMALSLGSTPIVVASEPVTAREILMSPHFADRPLKESARCLMFSRAIGFAPNGPYWRRLRRIAASHLFSPRRMAAHEPGRQLDCAAMLRSVARERCLRGGVVRLRPHLQSAALNNITGSVFGKRYDVASGGCEELNELREMVREGFELLGAFNWSDYLPWLTYFHDPHRIKQRCDALVPRVTKLVGAIIEQHRQRLGEPSDSADFVDVLLSLQGEDKLQDHDMVAVLWEMIFRGTDTVALLTEWVMAELVLHPEIQEKLCEEVRAAVPGRDIRDADVANMPYLQSVMKEALRVHPPGPLLSWARLSTSDVHLSNGMVVPANTTAMVNMWAITHDPHVWDDPLTFRPERFHHGAGAAVDVRGGDLRLAPFGAGRRVCPGKNLGLATVSLWVAKLVSRFEWAADESNPVRLDEVLKLSCEMRTPLSAVVAERKKNENSVYQS